jgi:hypothetical protein
MSADKKTIAIGAPTLGKVRILSRIGNDFVEETVITESDEAGYAVALSAAGNTLVVGAPKTNGSIGMIRIYERVNGAWQEVGEYVGTGAVSGVTLGMGCSVSISADGSIVAAASAHFQSGGAWVFEKTGNVYTQVGNRLIGTPVGGNNPSHQGIHSLALSNDGKTLALPGNDSGGDGAVWIFSNQGDAWVQVQKILPPDGIVRGMNRAVDFSGDGNTLAVGASTTPLPNGSPFGAYGATIIYQRVNGIFVFQQKLQSIHSREHGNQGTAVSMSDNGLVIAVGECVDVDPISGGIRFWFKVGENWTEQPGLIRYNFSGAELDEQNPDDGQGKSAFLSADGRTLIMGSYENNFGAYLWETGLPPSISSFSPSIGSLNTTITISGSNLEQTDEVRVNGNLTTLYPYEISASQVKAHISSGSNSVGEVVIKTKSGQASLGEFTYVEAPVLNSFNPSYGGPGTIITVHGENFFYATGATIGNSSANIVVISDTEIHLTVDKGANGAIHIFTPGGEGNSLENFQFVTPPPQLTNFSPTSATPAETVTIEGENLWWVDEVYFGGAAATSFEINPEGKIEAVVGLNALSGDISVISEGGAASIGGFSAVEPAPVIYTIDPADGPVGSLVSIYGEQLVGATDITFNGTQSLILEKSGGKVKALVMPNTSSGTVQVEVGNNAALSESPFNVTPTTIANQQVGDIISGTSAVANTSFGQTIATSADGSVVVVGAPIDHIGGNALGSVRIFLRNQSGTLEEAQVIRPNNVSGELFGTAVALSATGSTLVLAGQNTRTVFFYERNAEAQWELTNSIIFEFNSTMSLAISGDGKRLVVGSNAASGSPLKAHVVERDGDGWHLTQALTPPGEVVNGLTRTIKVVISLDGNTFAISSPADNTRKGAIWIYRYDFLADNWPTDVFKILPNDALHNVGLAAQFGSDIAITADGSKVVCAGKSEGLNAPFGAFWSFAYDGQTWAQQGSKVKSQDALGSAFCTSISLSASGNLVATGSPGENGGIGAFWLFNWDGAVWNQVGNKIVPIANVSQKGEAVTLTPDGSILFCGSKNQGFFEFRNAVQPYKPSPSLQLPSSICSVGDLPVTLLASSNSNGTISYHIVSGGSGAATLNADQFTPISAGIVNIRAFQEATENFTAADAFATITIESNQVEQTISFDPITNKNYGDAPFFLSATASSGLPVTFESSNENVAIAEGSEITVVGVGEVTITASQAGNSNFTPAQNVQQSFTISKGNQEITFNTIPSKTFGDPNFSLSVASNSALPISFESSDLTVATINGSEVIILRAGNAIITASQSGNTNYNAAISAQQPLTITKADQQITFDPVTSKTFGDPNFPLNVSANSELTVTLESDNHDVATTIGNEVIIVGVGEAFITASQPGNENYNAATSVQHLLTVAKANQQIVFNPITTKSHGDSNFSLIASTNSQLPITFESNNHDVATIIGNEVTIIGAGDALITASQPGNENYNAATNVQHAFTVGKVNQEIIFNPLEAKTYGDPDFSIGASTNSGLPITFESDNLAVAVISGNKIIIVGAGTANITALQPGNVNFNMDVAVQLLTVNKADQQIQFAALDKKTYGDKQFSPSVTIDTGLPIVYGSSNPSVATVVENNLEIVSAGLTTITASQAGNSNYNPAHAEQILTVSQKSQDIIFLVIGTHTFGDLPFIIDASASSGLPVNFVSDNPLIATIAGNKVTIVGAGIVTITATQNGNENYLSVETTQQIEINKAAQVIDFDELSPKNILDAPFPLEAEATSGLPIIFQSSDSDVIAISANLASIGGDGSAKITASQPGNENFLPALSVHREQVVYLVLSIESKRSFTTLYPNPTDGVVKFHTEHKEGLSFSIVDGSGRQYNQTMVRQIESGLYECDFTNLGGGAYYIIVNELPGNIFRVFRR